MRALGGREPGQLDQVVTRPLHASGHLREPGEAQHRAAPVRLVPRAEELHCADLEAGLLPHLAPQSLDCVLALVQEAARQVPAPGAGIGAPPPEQHATVAHDDRLRAGHGIRPVALVASLAVQMIARAAEPSAAAGTEAPAVERPQEADDGESDDMRVVLIHSAVGDSRLWRRQVEALAGRFDVVAPDLPGFGETPAPAGPVSLVDETASLLPGALVGNSFGGGVALRTALAHPELVSRLVLVAAGLPDWDWSDELRSYWAAEEEAFEAGDLDGAVQINLDFWVKPEHQEEVRPQQRRVFELQSEREPELTWPEMPPLSSLAVPTLVVVGTDDKADFRAIAERLAAEIPDADLAVVAGAGHLVGLDQPDELNALLLEFLEDGVR